MAKVIAIANQKGGVSKTYTAIHLGVALANLDKKVLVLDFDSQAHFTNHTNTKSDVGIGQILLNQLNDQPIPPKSEYIKKFENVDVIPSSSVLSGVEFLLSGVMNRENRLKYFVDSITDDYDYILIDCATSLGTLPINALASADSVLIPVFADPSATESITQMLSSITQIRKNYINPNLVIEGILFNAFEEHIKDSQNNYNEVVEKFGQHIKIFDTKVRKTVYIKEAVKLHQSAFNYAKNNKMLHGIKQDYTDLAMEVLSNDR